MSTWALLGAPIIAAFCVVGINTYLGLHILRRGVIFVDLALAQVAALGALIAFLVDIEPGTIGAELFSLVFALLGAGLFAVMKLRPGVGVPQEALIGLVYAFASALAMLVMAKAPEGAEHLKETLTGSLLWVQWRTVIYGAVIYGLVGAIHFVARKELIALSENAKKVSREARGTSGWDFLFYGTFAIVVSHAVSIAGVLLVFTFLVAPAVLAMIWFRSFRSQLLFGWALGAVVCVAGMGLSFELDLPAAPTVVSVYAAVLAAVGVLRWVGPTPSSFRPKRLLAGGGTLGTALLALFTIHELGSTGDIHGHDHAPAPEEPQALLTPTSTIAASEGDARGLLTKVNEADLPVEKESACASESSLDRLEDALKLADEGFDRLALATCLLSKDKDRGQQALASIATDAKLPEMVRDQAQAALDAH